MAWDLVATSLMRSDGTIIDGSDDGTSSWSVTDSLTDSLTDAWMDSTDSLSISPSRSGMSAPSEAEMSARSEAEMSAPSEAAICAAVMVRVSCKACCGTEVGQPKVQRGTH